MNPSIAQSSLPSLISDLPDEILPRIKRGFDVAQRLSDASRREATTRFLKQFEQSGAGFEGDWLEAITGAPRSDARTLVTSISIVVGLLTQSSASVEDLVEAARGRLFEDRSLDAFKSIVEIVSGERSAIAKTIEDRTIAAETLPSLEGFHTSVDLRFRFEKDDLIVSAVPVALVHIDTDSRAELFLQMSRGDVDMVIEKLQRVAKRMDAATTLFEKSRN
jgi:hypothetical protein